MENTLMENSEHRAEGGKSIKKLIVSKTYIVF